MKQLIDRCSMLLVKKAFIKLIISKRPDSAGWVINILNVFPGSYKHNIPTEYLLAADYLMGTL